MDRAGLKATFPILTDGFVDILLAEGIGRKMELGQVLYEEGFPCEAVPFILSGSVRVFKIGATGREITLYRVAQGETCILSTSCSVSGASYPAIAEVEEAGEMVALPAMRFRQLLGQYPEVQRLMCETLSNRLADMMAVVDEIAFRRMDIRLAERLLAVAQGNRATVQTTHAQLAVELGTAREVVSRILKDFENQGLLKLGRGWIEVAEPKRLREMADKG